MKDWWFIVIYVILMSLLIYKLTVIVSLGHELEENRSGEVFEVSDRYWF